MKKQLLLFLLSFLCLEAIYSQTYYVDANVVGGVGDGSSWANAFPFLQDALDVACMNASTAEIWVAKGTYYPDEGTGQTDDDRNSTFELCDGVAIYGGFSGAGTETMLSDRDFETNVTILSGDLRQDDGNFPNGNNAYTVVTGSNTDATAILDGFTITAGNANGQSGDGLDRHGGGMYNSNGAPTVANCIFTNNSADNGGGGGMYNSNSSPMVSGCTFFDNVATNGGGGGMFNINSAPMVTNCVFSENITNVSGGGMANASSPNAVIINCIFSGNAANGGGGGMANLESSPMLIQLDANGAASFDVSLLDGGSTGCPPLSFTVNGQSSLDFTCADVGSLGVTLTVTDVFSENSTCAATISVEDNVAPEALCQDVTVQLGASVSASLTATQVDNGSNDACGIGSLSLDETDFDCDDVGTNTVTLTVTDVNGNFSTCTATVTVEDNVAPDAKCDDIDVRLDEDGEASIDISDIDDGSEDACGIANLSLNRRNFDCSDVGEKTVRLTVTDVNGNSSTCTATVTVEDQDDPEAVCRDITIQLGPDGTASISPGDVDDGSSDACGIDSRELSQEDFTCADVGPNVVTLNVSDESGNERRCLATVTVEGITLPPILYVDDNAAPGGDGSSWTNAFQDLQDALDLACGGCAGTAEIWVADGLYIPSRSYDFNNDGEEQGREASFQLCNGVAIYGGFEGQPGTEGDFSSRNLSLYVSTLSGDRDQDDGPVLENRGPATPNDNAYHVVSGSNTNATAILDGFTVTAGNARGTGLNEAGGGMLNFNGSPSLANLVFAGNTADGSGGGMANFGSSPSLLNCIFSGSCNGWPLWWTRA